MRYSNEELASMTQDQLGEIRKNLPSPLQYNKQGVWSDDDKHLDMQLRCLSMIDACLAYQTDFMEPRPYLTNAVGDGSYAYAFIQYLGDEEVKKLYNYRKDYFDNHVKILRDIDIDSESVTYNAIEEY